MTRLDENHLSSGERARVLVEALPYIKRFHGQKIVVKLGGVAMEQRKEETLLDIVLLRYVGMLPVLVHGGGAEITSMSDRLGLKAEFKRGLRVTDAPTMEVVKMVLTGKINPDLVASLNRLGGQAVGMSGEDGPSIIAEGHDADLGFVGRVTQVNAEPIDALINRGYIPVMASIGLGFLGAWATFVVFAWRDSPDFVIPAGEVARIDREIRSQRAQALGARA